MSLQLSATGTIRELEAIWGWAELCKLIHVDWYNRSMVPSDEVFTITHKDLSVLLVEDRRPICGVCGTTENVRYIGGDNPYKCPSGDCVSF